MRYLLLITGREDEWAALAPGDPRYGPAAIASWEAEHRRAGRIVDGHELAPTTAATTLRREDGRVVVTDGPFTEAKEAIGGYYLIEVPDLDAAIALARASPFTRIADIEIRPIIGASRLEGPRAAERHT